MLGQAVYVAFGVTLTLTAVAAQLETNSACDLDCKNNGVCKFIATKNETLKALVQAGQLVQRCECTELFTGTGCEIEKTPCNLVTKTCFNGAACQLVDGSSEDYHCNCAVASAVSTRASQMCRRPYTEYCGSEYKPNKPNSFCTNGGKCKGSLLAARLAPGNTTVNAKFEQAGCICPPEFYGPHCEFLHHTKVVARPPTSVLAPRAAGSISAPTATPTLSGTVTAYPTSESGSMEDLFDTYDSLNAEQQPDPSEDKSRNPKSRLLLTVFMCVLFAIGLVFFTSAYLIYRQRRQQTQKRQALLHGPRRTTRSRHTRNNSKRSDVTDRGASEGETLGESFNEHQPIIQLEGTANLAPFAIFDDGKMITDDNDHPTDDDCTIWTDEPTAMASVSPVVHKRPTTQGGGGWIKSMSERMDSLTGGAGPVTNGCGGSIGSAYMVDDDDETIASIATATQTVGLSHTGSATRETASYLERYRHHAYLVGGDDDMEPMGAATATTAPSWATLSGRSRP